MPFELSKEALISETEGVLDAITHPAFVEEMQRFRSISGDERIRFAEKHLVPTALADRGVPLPDEMRVSSRVFEEGDPGGQGYVDYQEGKRIIALIREKRPDLLETLRSNNPKIWEDLQLVESYTGPGFVDPADPSLVAVGACGCACGGAATVCGGAGGGGSTNAE